MVAGPPAFRSTPDPTVVGDARCRAIAVPRSSAPIAGARRALEKDEAPSRFGGHRSFLHVPPRGGSRRVSHGSGSSTPTHAISTRVPGGPIGPGVRSRPDSRPAPLVGLRPRPARLGRLRRAPLRCAEALRRPTGTKAVDTRCGSPLGGSAQGSASGRSRPAATDAAPLGHSPLGGARLLVPRLPTRRARRPPSERGSRSVDRPPTGRAPPPARRRRSRAAGTERFRAGSFARGCRRSHRPARPASSRAWVGIRRPPARSASPTERSPIARPRRDEIRGHRAAVISSGGRRGRARGRCRPPLATGSGHPVATGRGRPILRAAPSREWPVRARRSVARVR